MLDLIGHAEGTDRGRGYNETLAYGAYTGGPVDLVSMTLDEVDALQTRMLRHPNNYLKSSAVGRYQIIRTTLRWIRGVLGLTGKELYDEALQDRLACFLLGFRGIDKWLAGEWTEDRLINNLAEEWASLPTTRDVGFHKGQNNAVNSARVRAVLAEVRARHIEVTVDTPEPADPSPGASLPDTADIDTVHRMAELSTAQLQALLVTAVLALGIKQGLPIGGLAAPAPAARPTLTFSPEQPTEQTMETKRPWQSKTLIGIGLAVLPILFPEAAPLVLPLQEMTGVTPQDTAAVNDLVNTGVQLVGLILGAYGTFVRKTKISLKD
jgi:muramidase (phage lysozyme)